MKIGRILGVAVICLSFAVSVMAQGAPQGQAPGGAPQGQAPGGAPQGQGGGSKLDMSPTFDAMDKNKDGKVTKEEWLASGMTQDSYDKLFTQMLDKNKDGVITKDELGVPLFDVDTNKDGKVSLEEFVSANKKAAASMGSGGQGGTPGGAQGAAPAGAAPATKK